MNYPTHAEEIHALSSGRERIAEMLTRYPRVTPAEAQEILAFLKTARHLDVGLLTSNDAIRSNLDSFMSDYRQHFQVRWSEGAMVIAAIAAILIVLWLISEAFS